MFSWLFGYKDDTPLLDFDSFEQTQNYIILQKMKQFEEKIVDQTNRVGQLEFENRQLHVKLKRSYQSLNILYNRIQSLEKKLESSIVFESLPPLIVHRN